jgi:hypothetical protein
MNPMKPEPKKEQELSEEELKQPAGGWLRIEGELAKDDLSKVSGGMAKNPIKIEETE